MSQKSNSTHRIRQSLDKTQIYRVGFDDYDINFKSCASDFIVMASYSFLPCMFQQLYKNEDSTK